MALFVDGPACTITDLTDEDSGLLDTALNAGIDASKKLQLACDEIRGDLLFWLADSRPAHELVWANRVRIEQVVVTPALKQWQKWHALSLVYRDACFGQLVDRYQSKWQEYARLAREARESFVAEGAALVHDPVAQAQPPVLATQPGPQPGGSFYASVSWVNATNQEGLTSLASSLTVTDGNLMTVSATGAPANATGFNVYAGTSLTALYRRNDVPLPPGATFLFIPGQDASAALPGNGQKPEFVKQLARMVRRG